ncbi:sensor histidine kinase [Paenibacillus sp. IB182496]|uniref:histidine kinase n=1 Tax=Paenibacillus sabuli TaxID=2772509 RepID=A0A927BVJ9_9BACL|nr:sensor histidine kinase [Paenibacillus sabuli]MBD2846304.1 sensor histidine kinase [Paenibacillus sabuli]
MPLYARLLLSFLVAILVPAALVGLFSYRKVSEAIEEEVSGSVRQTIAQANRNLSLRFAQGEELSTIVYVNSDVQRILSRQTPATWAQLQDDVRELRAILSNLTGYRQSYRIRLYYRDVGQFPDSMDVAELQALSLLDEAPGYREAMQRDAGMQWSAASMPPDAGGEPEVTLFRRLRSMADERELGAIAVSLPERSIWEVVGDVRIGKTGFVFLMDERGRIVSHHNKTLLGRDYSAKPYAARIMEGEGGDFRTTVGGRSHLFVYETIAGTPWKLVGFVPTGELRERIAGIKVAAIISALVGFGLAILYSIYISGRLARRIGTLTKAMRRLESGNLGTQLRLGSGRTDEITQLYGHFNRMSAELQAQVVTIHTTNEKMRAAELKALQHQINPHFLYNTLDAINWMAATRYNARDISTMVTALAQLFRLSLNKANELTTVAHELEHVRCYVTIQQVRFDSAFKQEVTVESGLERAPMIKLILQPLVENAIQHGFADLDEPGRIAIGVRRHGHELRIDVTDNGTGCDAARLNAMLDGAEPFAAQERGGYGLHNVNERIKLYAGSAYGLRFYSGEGGGTSGTRVQVRLPLWNERDERS